MTDTISSFSLSEIGAFIEARGPRYAVSYGAGPGRHHQARYVDTGQQAEALYDRLVTEDGWRQIRVHKPNRLVDLGPLGAERVAAKAAYDEATSLLRVAVIRAVTVEGRTEAEVAREADIDRGTVRTWLGK